MFFCEILSILLKKKFDLSTRVWVSIFDAPKLFLRGQTLGAKSAKKCYHVGTLEAFHLWSLATSVKAQRSTSWLSTNHIVGFLHLSNQPAKCEDPLSPGETQVPKVKPQRKEHFLCLSYYAPWVGVQPMYSNPRTLVQSKNLGSPWLGGL